METLPFRDVLELLEAHGWTLYAVMGTSRVFKKKGEALPIVFQVNDKRVDIEYVERIKNILSEGRKEEE